MGVQKEFRMCGGCCRRGLAQAKPAIMLSTLSVSRRRISASNKVSEDLVNERKKGARARWKNRARYKIAKELSPMVNLCS